MALIAAQSPKRAANTIAMSSAAELGDSFANDGKRLLLIQHTNAGGADVTLTVATPVEIDGEAVAEKEIVITKGTVALLGPWPKGWYNDEDGLVSLTYSVHTDIVLAVLNPK